MDKLKMAVTVFYSKAFRFMQKSFLFIALPLACFLFTIPAKAQQSAEKVQMADGMRSSGKIYVVVAVLVTVLAGLLIYIISLDRKISKLEKQSSL